MHKFINKTVITAMFAVIISAAGVTSASAQGDILGRILNRMDVNNKSIQSVQANVSSGKRHDD
jgi:hypothetical protein